MTGSGQYSVFGIYVTGPVHDALAESVYEAAGVVDLDDYFDGTAGAVPAGDPGAEATDALLGNVLEAFAALYDGADFAAAARVDPDAFDLVHLAARPERVARARELFQAAATIQDADLRTVQTAILAAHLEVPIATPDR
ncbi:hypothetical protein ACFO5R_21350 [Halosolutus amylolyticus]|uniref:Uncharacterized protein n=1 Tax=Halosolutus amylolyticus TaxID=2932267 RepID=A0ABD5PVQ6_9EURY|nr:hypothetical protein [Halosolutus amylolyticus]